MKITITALLVVCLAACTNNKKTNHEAENVAGGGCGYEDTVLPAVVLDLKKMDDGNYNIRFVVNGQDTVLYTSLHHQRHVPDSLIKAKNIQPGDTLCMTDSRITYGSCNPHIRSISLEKYIKR